jgi:hypothetical protein
LGVCFHFVAENEGNFYNIHELYFTKRRDEMVDIHTLKRMIEHNQRQIEDYERLIEFYLKELESLAKGERKFLNPIREIRSCLKVIKEYQAEAVKAQVELASSKEA